jgi:hypothetical protein
LAPMRLMPLCHAANAKAVAKTADIDPTGDFFTFEKGMEKTGGGKGFADVWYSDHFAIEYKGKLARCIEETLPHPRGEGSRGAGSANGVAATLSGLWRTRHSVRTATVRDTGS